jgi:hypothetical protein
MNIVKPINREIAMRACRGVTDMDNRNNCIADVMVTGEIGFAKTYLVAQRIEQAGTKTEIYPLRKQTREGDTAIVIAVVKRSLTGQRLIAEGKDTRGSIGTIQFYLDGRPVGEPVRVDRFGQARWMRPGIKAGEYKLSAEFIPLKGSAENLASRSAELVYVVR